MAKSLKEWERLWVERNERRGTSLGPNILSAASSSSSCARHPLGREHKPASSTDTLLALLGEYTGLILADKTSGNNIHFIIYRITEDDIPVAKATRLLRFQAFSHHCDAIDKAILKVVTNGYTSIRTVLAVIKEELDYPNVDINPEGDLSRIFQVLKNKTGINFYRDIDTAEAEMQVETVPSKIKQPILARGRLINPEVRRKLNEWTCLWTERKWRCSPDKIAIGPRISASDYSSSSTADSASVKKKKMIEPSDGVVFLALLGHYSGLINAAKTQGIDFQNGIYRLNHEDIPVAKAIRFFRMQIFSHHVDAVDRAMLEVIEKKYIDISVILAVLKEELNYPEVVINPDGDLHLIFAVVQRFTHVNFYEDIGSVDEEIEKVTAEKARKEQEEREHIRRESLITPEERKRQAEKEYQEKYGERSRTYSPPYQPTSEEIRVNNFRSRWRDYKSDCEEYQRSIEEYEREINWHNSLISDVQFARNFSLGPGCYSYSRGLSSAANASMSRSRLERLENALTKQRETLNSKAQSLRQEAASLGITLK